MEWGYVKISRKAYANDPYWLEPRKFSKWEAWEDMIQMAAFKKHRRAVGLEQVTLERGELLASRRYLARRWRWTEKAVRGFLAILLRTERIRAQREAQVGTIYLLVNYGAYQAKGPTKGPAKGHARAQQGPSEGPKEKAGKAVKQEENYTPEFEEAWKAYPQRRGGNSKLGAYRQWLARIAEGVTSEVMLAGTKRYAAELREAGKLDTPYVKQAATFYGRDRHFEYETPVTPIAKAPTTKMVAEHDGVRLRLVEVPLSDPRPAA